MTPDVTKRTDNVLRGAEAPADQLTEKCVGTSMLSILAMLNDGAEVDDVLRASPGLTRDDLCALLAEAVTQKEISRSDGGSTFISPQDFYRESVQREDIRRILAALAK